VKRRGEGGGKGTTGKMGESVLSHSLAFLKRGKKKRGVGGGGKEEVSISTFFRRIIKKKRGRE